MQTPHHDPIPRSHTLTLYSDPIPPILTPHPDPTRTAPLSPSPPPFPPSQRPIFCPCPSARLKHGGSAAPAAISRMFPLLNMATAVLTPSFFFAHSQYGGTGRLLLPFPNMATGPAPLRSAPAQCQGQDGGAAGIGATAGVCGAAGGGGADRAGPGPVRAGRPRRGGWWGWGWIWRLGVGAEGWDFGPGVCSGGVGVWV